MSIAAKMVTAMAAIDAVEKRGRNQAQGYAYVRATDVANEVRKVLHENGIAFAYSITDVEHWEKLKMDDKGNISVGMYICQIRVRGTFTDSESGEKVECDSVGWGADPLDKAAFKAMTGALKYLLRMAFLIPDESDPENDGGDRQIQEQPQVQRASTVTQQLRASVNMDAEPANEFDEHMARTPRLRPDGPKVSEAQAKRFFALAMGSGKSKAQINDYLGGNGYERSDEMLKSEYEKHCAWAMAK